jgi:outer membrane protein assembly factor BamD
MDDVKRLIKELQTKLEEKTYKSAVLYYDLGYFQSAYVAVKAALQESPSSAFREELMLLDMKARYEYADNSVLGKQAERYEDVIKSYTLFLDVYPQSQYLKVATRLQERAQNALDKLKVAQL